MHLTYYPCSALAGSKTKGFRCYNSLVAKVQGRVTWDDPCYFNVWVERVLTPSEGHPP